MPREPRCASGRMDARKGDDAVPGSGTMRRPDAADAGPRRNPKGRGVFGCMPVSLRLGASDPLCAVAHAPWPAAKCTPSRPRVILLEALWRNRGVHLDFGHAGEYVIYCLDSIPEGLNVGGECGNIRRRRGARAADRGGFENRCTALRYRGFESPPLRHGLEGF